MRRASVLVLLLLPALAGCVEVPQVSLPLDVEVSPGLGVSIVDPGGHGAGEEVLLQATPVLENASYQWRVGSETYDGPVLRWLALEAGVFDVVLTVTRGEELVNLYHTLLVAPGSGAAGDDDADGEDEEGEDGEDGDADPCGFTTESISVLGHDNVFTIGFPWTCQPDSWEWDLGDGTRSREAGVRHEYRREGAHTVTLTLVHDGETRIHTATAQVRNVPLRIVPAVDGNEVTFTLEWGREAVSVEWDLDNGVTSTEPSPVVTYPEAGPWTVTAAATDFAGQTATAETRLNLDAYPLRILAAVEQDTAELAIEWGWDLESIAWSLGPDCAFVDGTGADDPAPTVRCGTPGTHPVRLDVSGEGRSAVATSAVVVEQVPLRIHAIQDPDAGDRVTFAPVWHQGLSNHQWSLGDGATSTEPVVTHGYRAFGTFTVHLTATGGGQTRTASLPVTITDIPLRVTGTLSGNVWSAAIDWAPASTVSWDFGDGHAHPETSRKKTVQHTFADKGTFTVQVTAGDGIHSASWQGEVEVEQGLEPQWGDPDARRLRPGVQTTSGDLQCTAAFLLHDDWHRYFVATAAHCVGTPGGAGGQFSPDCTRNRSFPLGTEVTFHDWGADGQEDVEDVKGSLVYSSWKTMAAEGVTDADTCIGNDFALIELDRDDVDRVHPAVLHFGGPVALGAEGGREQNSGVRAYGASATRGTVTSIDPDASNAKGGRYDSYERGWSHSVQLDNPAIPGDSGGPLLNVGGDALGVLSTISSDGTNQYTDLAKAIGWMEAHTDLDVDLVTWPGWDPSLPTPSSDDPLACLETDLCD